MRGIQSKKNNKGSSKTNRVSSCSYCRDTAHSAPHCPHAPLVWKSLQKGIIPLAYLSSVRVTDKNGNQPVSGWRNPLCGYLTMGRNWGDLYSSTEKANAMVEKRILREKEKSKKGSKKANKKVTQICGFCKGKGHSRRNCTDLTHWKAQLKKANRNFRKWFYEEYVVKQGLSTGAILSFEHSTQVRYNTPSKTFKCQSIVTAVNWDTVNVFALLPKKKIVWQDEIDGKKSEALRNVASFFESPVLCKVPVTASIKDSLDRYSYGNRESSFVGIPFLSDVKNANNNNSAFYNFDLQTRANRYHEGNGVCNVKVISRAEQTLPSDWIDGYSDEMSVVFSKYSLKVLEFLGIPDFINQWAFDES